MKEKLTEWSNYFEDCQKFITLSKKLCKKLLPNYIETSNLSVTFQNKKGKFCEIACLIPTGEDEEFLQLLLKKLK